MGTFVIHEPYVIGKPTGNPKRWYWQPNKAIRDLGFHPEALGDDPHKALVRAKDLNQQVKDARSEDAPPTDPRSVKAMIAAYQADPEAYGGLKPRTKRGYDQCAALLEKWCGDKLPDNVSVKAARAWYRVLREHPYQAAAVVRFARLVWAWGKGDGYCSTNPWRDVRIRKPEPRQIVHHRPEIERFIEAARPVRRSIAVAAMLAFELCQREGDVLTMPKQRYDGLKIIVRQDKTGALVTVPLGDLPELKSELDTLPATDATTLLVNESTGRPWNEHTFRHEVAKIAKAAKLEDFRFADLRRAGLTEAGNAGASDDQLRGLSGHTGQTVRLYVVPSGEMAAAAIAKRKNKTGKV